MISIALALFSVMILGFELYLGVVVTGFSGDELYVERSKQPESYWLFMTLHLIIGIGLPVLAWFAGL